MNIKNPDTISNIAPDCRRALRDDYRKIQAAIQLPQRPSMAPRINIGETKEQWLAECERMQQERRERIAEAVAEYKRTAQLWGVPVLDEGR